MKESTYTSKYQMLSKEEKAAADKNVKVVMKVAGLKDAAAVASFDNLISTNSVYSLVKGKVYHFTDNEPHLDKYNGNEYYYYNLEDGKRITARCLFSRTDPNDYVFENDKKGYLTEADKGTVSSVKMVKVNDAVLAITQKKLTVTYLGKVGSKDHDWDTRIYSTAISSK